MEKAGIQEYIIAAVVVAGGLYFAIADPFADEPEKPAIDQYVDLIAISQDDTPENQRIVRRAAKLLFQQCPGFGRYYQDFIRAEAWSVPDLDQGKYRSYLVDWLGWTDYVIVTINVRERVQRIPRDFNADGHTLWYYVGAGEQPGIVGKKTQTQKVCGSLPVESSTDTFHPVPGAQFVSGLQ